MSLPRSKFPQNLIYIIELGIKTLSVQELDHIEDVYTVLEHQLIDQHIQGTHQYTVTATGSVVNNNICLLARLNNASDIKYITIIKYIHKILFIIQC